jgi:hypothetical protein
MPENGHRWSHYMRFIGKVSIKIQWWSISRNITVFWDMAPCTWIHPSLTSRALCGSRQEQPSNQGDIDSSVMRKVGRFHYIGNQLLISFLYLSSWLLFELLFKFCTVLHWTALNCTALHWTALNCTELHYTIQSLPVLASTVILWSDFRGTHDHILLSQIQDSHNLKDQVPVFISPRNRVPRFTPRHWVPFSSPPMTRRATVEVFEPPPTVNMWALQLYIPETPVSNLNPNTNCFLVFSKSLQGNSSIIPRKGSQLLYSMSLQIILCSNIPYPAEIFSFNKRRDRKNKMV